MATGITGYEKLSTDSLTAALPHKDPHPLPPRDDDARLTYPNRLSEAEILQPLPASFVALDSAGKAAAVAPIEPNSFVLSDNLFALHNLAATGRKATLIYLDPPYNTGMEFQSRQLEHSYSDQLGPAAYIEYMRRRLILMREVLAEDGSIYVHIGHHMLSHLKIVMDEIFGRKNFRNIITRRKCSSKNFTRHQYSNLNDFLLFYTKTADYKWHQPGREADPDWLEREYPKNDKRGRYKLVPIHAPGTRRGATGEPWRDMMPPPGKHWQYPPEKLEGIDKAGEMHWSRNGNPRRKVYLTGDKLVPYTDYWDNFRDAHHQSIAVTGYPTEKNFAMLRMIVAAGTDAGDLVLDPFCGSGTTMHAANDLGRHWIGIDQSFNAIKACITRFRHGVKPMGDFVARNGNGKSHANGTDLFGEPIDARRTRTNGRFSFLVDEELLANLAPDLTAIASI